MKEIRFINAGKDVVKNFPVRQELRNQHGRDWVFQIADGLMKLSKTDAKSAVILYDEKNNRFLVRGE